MSDKKDMGVLENVLNALAWQSKLLEEVACLAAISGRLDCSTEIVQGIDDFAKSLKGVRARLMEDDSDDVVFNLTKDLTALQQRNFQTVCTLLALDREERGYHL